MHAKKPKKTPRSIRYLLSANPKLEKISLKKLSSDTDAKKRPRSAGRSKESESSTAPLHLPWTTRSRAVVLTAIPVTIVAVLIALSRPGHQADVAAVDAPLDAAPHVEARAASEPLVLPEKRVVAAQPETAKDAAPRPFVSAAAPKTHTPDAGRVTTPVLESPKPVALESSVKPVAVEPLAKAPGSETAAKSPPAEPATKAPVAESTAKAEGQNASSVTITGCLEHDDEAFWLKDTTGVDAPKSRSWRSGFLKKRASAIELVDSANTLKLTSYVGQRVAATGVLTKGEMKARSLQRVAASCS